MTGARRTTLPAALSLALALAAAPGGAAAQSLYREGAAGASLFSDLRARGVNDIVTIIISEQSASSRSATTKTSQDTSRTAGVNQLPTMSTATAIIRVVFIWSPFLFQYECELVRTETPEPVPQTTLIVTSTLPRMALEYGQVWWAASARASATSRSKPGRLILRRAPRK